MQRKTTDVSLQKCSAWFPAICFEPQSGLLGIETAGLNLDGPCGQGKEMLVLEGVWLFQDMEYGRYKMFLRKFQSCGIFRNCLGLLVVYDSGLLCLH